MNKKQEFFNNDVEVNVSEDDIILAPPTELYDEAKEIAQNTTDDAKFPFILQYDANQKDHLRSMLQMVGAVVEDDDEEGHKLFTRMNMTQLAFIKRLESVERVMTNEVHNPFLMEEAERLATVAETTATVAEPQTVEAMQPAQVMTLAADETVEAVAEPAMANANDGIAVACVGGSSSSCCCPTNKDMQSAQTITVGSLVGGRICCPGAEQWFKFTVPQTKQYTIYTSGSLDTVGTLYDCSGNRIEENDDLAGKLNFRIVKTLSAGCVYYIRVGVKHNATGSYTLKVTDNIFSEKVILSSKNGNGVVILEQGKTYELPRGQGYNPLFDDMDDAPVNVLFDPPNTTDKRVSWYASSSPSDPVDIISDWYDNTTVYYTIKANSVGAAKLYASDWNERGESGMIYVAVIPNGGSLKKATGISLDYTSLTLEIGEYQNITATVSPSTATVKDVDWESDNPSVATVTPFGRVKAIAPGTATIRAKAMDGSGVYGCCNVNVSSHIYNATLSENGNEYTFACTFPQCDESFTVPRDQVIGSYVTSSTDPHLGNSQTPLAYGIDVSDNQEEISQSQWNEIANTQIDGHTITFAILRIGSEQKQVIEGVINRVKDEYFDSNYERAKAAGLQVGCYYCTGSWSPQNAVADAEQVIAWIGDRQFEYPVFFDVEEKSLLEKVPNNTVRTEICIAFMNKMREAGFFTGLYTNNAWLTESLNTSMLFPEYDVWYARYYDHTPNSWGANGENKWAGLGKKFGMWQYTDKKYIPPIPRNVDCDVAYKNYPLIIKALHLNNFN